MKRLQQLSAQESSTTSIDIDDVEELDAQEAYDALTIEDENESDMTKILMSSVQNTEIQVLTKCVNLAKRACLGRHDYKVRKVIDIINEITRRENDPKVKILIFTEFISTQYYLGEILEGLGYKVAYLNGKMNLDEKIEAKLKFKEDYQFLIFDRRRWRRNKPSVLPCNDKL